MYKEIRFVTTNVNKFNEAEDILSRYGIKLIHVPADITEIQSTDLVDIVIHKVMEAVKIVNPPLIVEDTGLFINALNGFPGPYASYVYNTLGLSKILSLLRDASDRSASFIAVGALVFRENMFKIFRARVDGYISTDIRGNKGFGYDPIFIPTGSTRTFAEMGETLKNKYSHRGKLFSEIGRFIEKISQIDG